MIRNCILLLFFATTFAATGKVCAQHNTIKKYPSLFWEITGNGLKKPSYLFGTMHVSSKMVFHLSDSFYYAMKQVDAVALELNPDLWQGQMVRLDRLKENYANFIQQPGGDFLNESSFRIGNYDAELKSALGTEPTVVNSLLYRTYKAREDFEEDTFLDLYIFQTGKKLGKRSAGVEDYNETEKVVLEAYADMAKEKRKKDIDMDMESMRDIGQKIQDAYRTGDLDLMDSLDILTERSDAFREKFLYKRNEIQAGSIDTILKKSSLFVGVGAAHLPGPRGVIELLRKMGYTLRPIRMSDRDAARKEETDQMKVPVTFATVSSEDGSFSVSMPGPLFRIKDENQRLDRRQYSDMSNGSFYMVTRVKTFAPFLGESSAAVLKRTDSLLYENIPGKIIRKTPISNHGYPGFDIVNRTRRGDLQRYNIFVTPFEIFVFKMSGKENYVDGPEAARFFSSIQLRATTVTGRKTFTPTQGGFSIALPSPVNEHLDYSNNDGINRWDYSARDSATGNCYLVLRKSVYNFKFLEEDSFDLKLMETSFHSSEYFDKQLSRRLLTWNGYPCLEVREKWKNGQFVTARFVIKGPHYYCVAMRSANQNTTSSDFFNSFRFTPYQYSTKQQYVDTFLHFSVSTPVHPELDEAYRDKLEQVSAEVANSSTYSNYNSYWPKPRHALFTSDSTGETVAVSVQKYPKYYVVKDSANFWTNELNGYFDDDDLALYSKEYFSLKNGSNGYRLILRDTGSSRAIYRMILQKDNYLFSLATIADTLHSPGSFVEEFFASFTPEDKRLGKSIYSDNLDDFFADLFSTDSTTHARAQQVVSNLYYGEKGLPRIVQAIAALKPGKDYLDTKAKLIAELGYIRDTSTHLVVPTLERIYKEVGDTSVLQNEVLQALARNKTTAAILLFKKLVLQEPPFFENDYDYEAMFNKLEDSLQLAVKLYPEFLQLAGVDDYKKPVLSLLVKLVDSGHFRNGGYQEYFNKIYYDGRIAWKKQQGKEEKKFNAIENENEDESNGNYDNAENKTELNNYAVLLLPFFEKNNSVPVFFNRLLRSKDDEVRFNAATLLLKNSRPVADSIIGNFAQKDRWRGKLFTALEEMKQTGKFPEQYKTQQALARSYLVAQKDYESVDSIVLVDKQVVSSNHKKGNVYFFKYRVKKTDEWKIGIAGLQPSDSRQVSSDNSLTLMTEKKLRNDIPLKEQFQEQLQRLLFTFHKSARNFFDGDNSIRISQRSTYQEP